jgi:hypothetical protein
MFRYAAANARFAAREQGVRVLQALAFPHAKLPAPRVEVLVFDRDDQLFALHGDKQAAGYFRASNDVTFEPHLLVLSAPRGGMIAEWSDLRQMALHEWTHGFVRAEMPRAPTWLNEGLATYWMTMEFDGNSTDVIVGRPTYLTPAGEWPPLADVIGADAQQFYDRRDRLPYYSASWGVVHYLYEHDAAKVAKLGELLAAGREQADAWRTVVGMAPAALDAELRARYGSDEGLAHRMTRPALAPVDPEAVRALSPAEVHILWARAAGWDDDDTEKRARAAKRG